MTSAVHLPVLPGSSDFDAALRQHGCEPLTRGHVKTLQVNVGKLCNMACLHCHVDAGPTRTEIMPLEVVEHVLRVLRLNCGVATVDVTGGAPELNPHFRYLVEQARHLGRAVIDRCNLTVLEEPGQEDLADFLAAHQVHVVASLPCYGPDNVNRQRGKGAFEASVRGLRRLNALGYGQPGSPLELDLVYNPGGPSLPPGQASLEARYREELSRGFGISFTRLLTLTNMPIARFAHALERDGRLASYMALLEGSFNASTAPGVMCRSLVSVGWDGRLYDCDFNQMLSLPIGASPWLPPTIAEVQDLRELDGARVRTGSHCFGCTAGAGSSCSGAVA